MVPVVVSASALPSVHPLRISEPPGSVPVAVGGLSQGRLLVEDSIGIGRSQQADVGRPAIQHSNSVTRLHDRPLIATTLLASPNRAAWIVASPVASRSFIRFSKR